MNAVNIPVQITGGMSHEQAIAASRLTPLIVIGAPLVISNEMKASKDSNEELREVIAGVVKEAKKQHNIL